MRRRAMAMSKLLDVSLHGIGLTNWFLVGGWATPLKNMKVNWDDYKPNINGKIKNGNQTTNQNWFCHKTEPCPWCWKTNNCNLNDEHRLVKTQLLANTWKSWIFCIYVFPEGVCLVIGYPENGCKFDPQSSWTWISLASALLPWIFWRCPYGDSSKAAKTWRAEAALLQHPILRDGVGGWLEITRMRINAEIFFVCITSMSSRKQVKTGDVIYLYQGFSYFHWIRHQFSSIAFIIPNLMIYNQSVCHDHVQASETSRSRWRPA